jgi:phosphohistidine phosphatase
MTLRLILTRHAKSSWDDPLADDHERVLNARGIGAARAIGRWLAVKRYRPDLVLCSTAERTRETWDLIADASEHKTQVKFDKRFYLASPDAMLNELRDVTGAQTVMIVAHNPGIGLTAAGLATGPPLHPQSDRYPSGATMVMDFDAADWKDIIWGSGVVVDFVVPKELETTG